MRTGWKIRLFVSIIIIIVSLFVFVTSIMPQKKLPGWVRDMINWRLNLGLDLQGGIHLVMGVDVNKALKDKADAISEEMKDYLKQKGVKVISASRIEGTDRIKLVVEKGDFEKTKDIIRRDYTNLKIKSRNSDSGEFILEYTDRYTKFVKDNAVDQAIKTIRNRVDEFGVSEPTISRFGESSILIQLPGMKDPDRAKSLIGKTAQLEFKIVDDESDFMAKLAQNLPEGIQSEQDGYEGKGGKIVRYTFLKSKDKKKLEEFLKGKVPKDHQVLFQKYTQKLQTWYRTFYLFKKTALTGDYIIDANVQIQRDNNRPYVSLTFNRKGAEIFERVTKQNVKKRMAIILDNQVISAPVIQQRIAGGRAQITLGALKSYQELLQEAKDLALVLRAGALPAPVTLQEERTVGPTLGKDSIRKGIKSIIIGMVLVVVFMAFYYNLSGVLADIALLFNIIITLAIMALFNATLTLPGLAGILLTVGMAVDANVLILERVREEIRSNKMVKAAIERGYSKAFWTIFDANITTFIAALVLMEYGSGPIKGFAVTLSIGILSSMYTAIVLTRLVYDYLIYKKGIKRLLV